MLQSVIDIREYVYYDVYKEVYHMRTNIVLDDKLMEAAFSLSKKTTKKELVQEALEEYVANRKIKNLLDIEGKIEFFEGYDYKEMREEK